MQYSDRFWKKNWDTGFDDLNPEEYDTTFVDMLSKTFGKAPDNPAIIYLGVTITYGNLNKYANQFANMLIDQGFMKGDVVGIHLPNTPQYLITLIGTLRAGCIVSGVSPLLSTDQIAYQLNDLSGTGKNVALVTLDELFAAHITKIASEVPKLKLVVTTNPTSFISMAKQRSVSNQERKLPNMSVLDYHRGVLDKYSSNFSSVEIKPDDIGWIQYTGGTTGAPKGAMISHRNASHNIISTCRWMGWDRRPGMMLSGFPMFHIAGLTVCQCALNVGWPQVVIPNPRDTDLICNLINALQPTDLINVPSLYQMLMANSKFKELDFSTLKICISAASPFPKESQIELEKIIGQGKLLELYGMTETSPISLMNPVEGPKKLGTVGMPIFNTEVKIVNPESGEITPPGEPGEICIKGPMVMQGYFNKPEATRKTIDDDGFLHTGDVGIMDDQGYVQIVDRTKDMIIVSGFKVFSSKVEDIISQHPAVGSMALVGNPNPNRPGSEIVKAYIQLDVTCMTDLEEAGIKDDIINYAREHCAPYEVPREIEIIPEIPLTAVGKINKKILRVK